MKDVRWLGAMQVAISVVAPSLLPWVGVDGVIFALALSNAFGGVAHIYGWKNPPLNDAPLEP